MRPTRLVVALALSTAGFGAMPALAQVHGYGGLALSPAGDRIATTEVALGAAGPGQARHAAITLRQASDGRVIRVIDPCAKCSYQGVTFAPDGTIAFVTREAGAATASLMVADARGATRLVATIPGLAQTPLARRHTHRAAGDAGRGQGKRGDPGGRPPDRRDR